MLTDPDVRFIPLLASLFLVTTEVGYDIQKFVSPFAIKFDFSFGTHAMGIGVDVSIGLPQFMPSYRAEVGATYFFNRLGGYGEGWQTRIGGEYGIATPGLGGYLRYGGTQYRDFDTNGELLADQVVHRATLGVPLLNVMYENDTKGSFPLLSDLPLLPSMRDMATGGWSDRYRTNRDRIRFGLVELDLTMHTGEPTGRLDGNFTGGSVDDPRRSNGILSLGLLGFRIGLDSEPIRDFFQNNLHDFFGYSRIPRTNRNPRFVFQWGGW